MKPIWWLVLAISLVSIGINTWTMIRMRETQRHIARLKREYHL